MTRNYGILLHGGARIEKISASSDRGERICKYISLASNDGFSLLKRGDSATDAVEAAVVTMEDSGVFNAGTGSCLTIEGRVEMDASIMSGRELSAGSVGMVRDIPNPIKLARQIMDKSDHVMLVASGALAFAKLTNMQIKKNHPSLDALDKYAELKKNFKNYWNKNSKMLYDDLLEIDPYGTVGAVALDREGNMASAVSTGGRWLKMSGRIGDSAIIGAGIYADNKLGAACATGNGEYIMKLCLSKYTCDRMKTKNASICCRQGIKELTRIFGDSTGGVIAIDRHGRFGIAHNTPSMPVSFMSNDKEKNMTFLSNP